MFRPDFPEVFIIFKKWKSFRSLFFSFDIKSNKILVVNKTFQRSNVLLKPGFSPGKSIDNLMKYARTLRYTKNPSLSLIEKVCTVNIFWLDGNSLQALFVHFVCFSIIWIAKYNQCGAWEQGNFFTSVENFLFETLRDAMINISSNMLLWSQEVRYRISLNSQHFCPVFIVSDFEESLSFMLDP